MMKTPINLGANTKPESVESIGYIGLIEIPEEQTKKLLSIRAGIVYRSRTKPEMLWLPETNLHITVAHIITPSLERLQELRQNKRDKEIKHGIQALRRACKNVRGFEISLNSIEIFNSAVILKSKKQHENMIQIRKEFSKRYAVVKPSWTRDIPEITHSTIARYLHIGSAEYRRLIRSVEETEFTPIKFEVNEIIVAKETRLFASKFEKLESIKLKD